MPAVRPGRTLLRAERKLLTLQAEAAFLAWAGKGCQLRADSQSKGTSTGPKHPSVPFTPMSHTPRRLEQLRATQQPAG
ncbi:unnamed protein product [Rangifer tarandus platyrhynchus]|uniref:Uncharacterized protein n=1 Tax=Rangifer tarandus platyrhynchus TaxID=3082113 RepID=A0AC59YN24_RANTA